MACPEWDSRPSTAVSATDNPLIRKLSHFAPLSESDRRILEAVSARDERLAADVDISSEGSVPKSVFLLKEGMAIRYRNLPGGGRQIMPFLIAGDLCDIHVFLLKAMDHSIGTITPVRVAPISRENMMNLFSHRHETATVTSGHLMRVLSILPLQEALVPQPAKYVHQDQATLVGAEKQPFSCGSHTQFRKCRGQQDVRRECCPTFGVGRVWVS